METFRVTVDGFLQLGGEELTVAHLHEAKALTAGDDAAIDWDMYRALEQSGSLLTIVVVEDNEMLGYVTGTAQQSIHNQGKYDFSTTAFYTRPEIRQQGVSKLLFETLCQVCRESGINDINYSVSERAPHSAFFVEKMGMHKAETMYSINLGVDDE